VPPVVAPVESAAYAYSATDVNSASFSGLENSIRTTYFVQITASSQVAVSEVDVAHSVYELR